MDRNRRLISVGDSGVELEYECEVAPSATRWSGAWGGGTVASKALGALGAAWDVGKIVPLLYWVRGRMREAALDGGMMVGVSAWLEALKTEKAWS
jgi:hypothetical protein